MQAGLHVAKVWVVHVFVVLGVTLGLLYFYAIVDADWRDRLSGDVREVTVTVTGQHRNEFGCGTKYSRPGWDWEVTWSEDDRTRRADWEHCEKAPPVGTRLTTWVTGNGTVGSSEPGAYYLWSVLGAVAVGSLLTPLWLRSRGRAAYEAIKAESA